ncbi:hypothetical protein C7M61_000558 [Candidozyma pseudohaemuli]|uniref:Uncharacterized protein n=1 Tax=Candidozyma pseudohaemuli TaxID=418784 RepID=A0A2P7YY74_9ASCO|nr:hypothetical protein C7M61_000558 [[Candida] pseudohaemulonii]PSK40894.1 hypothetical protein C7M61_000558 [[Candida] pseudohaemulonii]
MSNQEGANLNELEALTAGTEQFMFPDSGGPSGNENGFPESQNGPRVEPLSRQPKPPAQYAMQPLANRTSPPGTVIADAANNMYVIDQNGYAVPMRPVQLRKPQTPTEHIPKEIPLPPGARKKRGFYKAPSRLGDIPKASNLMQYHSEVMQAVRYDRFYQGCTTNRYGSLEALSIQNSSSNTSRGSNASTKLNTLVDRRSREWLQNDRTRRDLRNGKPPEQLAIAQPPILTDATSDPSNSSGRSSLSVTSYSTSSREEPGGDKDVAKPTNNPEESSKNADKNSKKKKSKRPSKISAK